MRLGSSMKTWELEVQVGESRGKKPTIFFAHWKLAFNFISMLILRCFIANQRCYTTASPTGRRARITRHWDICCGNTGILFGMLGGLGCARSEVPAFRFSPGIFPRLVIMLLSSRAESRVG